MADSELLDEQLWDEFHGVVNMSSRELRDWLRTESADPGDEELPDRAGSPMGRHILAVLGKRRTDLDHDDIRLMRRVVQEVRAERGDELESTTGDAAWRHRLMSVGHDPLKPADTPRSPS